MSLKYIFFIKVLFKSNVDACLIRLPVPMRLAILPEGDAPLRLCLDLPGSDRVKADAPETTESKRVDCCARVNRKDSVKMCKASTSSET